MAGKITQSNISDLIQLALRAELAKTAAEFKDINSKLADLGIKSELSSKNTNRKIIKEQLMPLIYKHVNGAQFYALLKVADTELQQSFSSFPQGNFTPEENIQALRNMQENFLHYEARSTHRKSLFISVLSCLFIVPIPFVKLIYNACNKSFAKNHFFERAFIAKEILEKQPGKNMESSYGALNKHAAHGTHSRKDNIRKTTDTGQFSNVKNDQNLVGKGLFFLGTKAQIESTKQKFAERAAPTLG